MFQVSVLRKKGSFCPQKISVKGVIFEFEERSYIPPFACEWPDRVPIIRSLVGSRGSVSGNTAGCYPACPMRTDTGIAFRFPSFPLGVNSTGSDLC